MKILYVASEAAPWVKTGGLGDVAGSLPQALAALGHDVRVVIPLYSAIDSGLREQMRYVKNFYVRLAWRNQYCGVFETKREGVTYYFLDNEYYFCRGQIYGEYDDAERFAFFSKAALDLLRQVDFRPDVLHCNDWQTALVSIYLRLQYVMDSFYEGMKLAFTIHNIQYQGRYGPEIMENVLGISRREYDNGFLEQDGDVNFMKGAIICSDAVTTVSPSYAQEIQSPYYAYGLEGVLRLCAGKLHGILNGIDTALYDPRTDPHLFAPYSAEDPAGKRVNKEELMRLCGLQAGEKTPVIGMVSRLVAHKGLDLVECVLDELLAEDVRLVVVGTGEWRYEQMFRQAQARFPGKVSAHLVFSGDLANKIYAGSDLFLMPSHSEPCGLAQMIAMRYGTIPVVRETGGLRDTVRPYWAETGEGTGFTFANYNAHDMLYVIRQACGLFRNDPAAWRALMKRDMGLDFSWDGSARRYVDVYQSL